MGATAVDAWGQTCSNPNQMPATGQTESYNANTFNANIAINDDGAVRAGPALSYADNGDGTITDNNTGLMWEKLAQVDTVNTGSGDIHDWRTEFWWSCPLNVSGMTVCGVNVTIWDKIDEMNRENYAGYSDWRAPNIRELQSIIDFEAQNPAVDHVFNNGDQTGMCTDLSNGNCSFTQSSSDYWSSTTESPGDTSDAYAVYSFNGTVTDDTKTDLDYFRAVRGGCPNGP